MRRKLASRKRAILTKPPAQTASEEGVFGEWSGGIGVGRRRASWKPWEGYMQIFFHLPLQVHSSHFSSLLWAPEAGLWLLLSAANGEPSNRARERESRIQAVYLLLFPSTCVYDSLHPRSGNPSLPYPLSSGLGMTDPHRLGPRP